MHTLNTYECTWFRFVFCLLFVFVLFLLFVFFIRIGLCYLILRIRFVTRILMKYIAFVNTRIAKYIMLQTVALSSTSFSLCLFFICESLISKNKTKTNNRQKTKRNHGHSYVLRVCIPSVFCATIPRNYYIYAQEKSIFTMLKK
jgi:phosphotransferase system  glucose/maltose/N-acetylglucosamine-specific IIC component